MNAIEAVKQRISICNEFRNEIMSGISLITGIVLISLGIHHLHFTQAHLKWVADFNPRVLEPLKLMKTALSFGLGGALLGGGVFLLKSSFLDKRSHAQPCTKKSRTFKKIAREGHFLYCLLTLITILATAVLVFYALHYLETMKKVYDLNSMGKFYFVGYLNKGHQIERVLALLTAAAALSCFFALETSDKLRNKK